MTFIPRPVGVTLRRVERYLEAPHGDKRGDSERFDEEFTIAMHCDWCGKLGWGPRKHMQEAIREHKESECPQRHARKGEPLVTRLLYPKDGKE